MYQRLCHSFDLFMLCTALVFGAAMSFASAIGPVPKLAGDVVLVIAPPWSDGARAIVQRAGGHPVGPISAPFGTLAVFDIPPPTDRLVALGAWTVRDGRSIASLCGVTG